MFVSRSIPMDEWKLALAKKRGGGYVGVGGVCGGGGGIRKLRSCFQSWVILMVIIFIF